MHWGSHTICGSQYSTGGCLGRRWLGSHPPLPRGGVAVREGVEEEVADALAVAGWGVVAEGGEWPQQRTLRRGCGLRPRALQWERSLGEDGGEVGRLMGCR